MVLQSEALITTETDNNLHSVTKVSYKVRQVLQSATVSTKWDVTVTLTSRCVFQTLLKVFDRDYFCENNG